MNTVVDMRVPCRFCKWEWKAWLTYMLHTAVDISRKAGRGGSPRIRELCLHQVEGLEVELIVTDDGGISSVNAHNLGCTGPTNILSFPGEGRQLGTLVLSAETLERECMLYGQDISVHARRLLAHGMGHIAGFDHGSEMDAFCSALEQACPDELHIHT